VEASEGEGSACAAGGQAQISASFVRDWRLLCLYVIGGGDRVIGGDHTRAVGSERGSHTRVPGEAIEEEIVHAREASERVIARLWTIGLRMF
jgi:hypothetical protein